MSLHGEGIGGVVFLLLYTVNFSILIYGYATKRIIFKSVYSFLLFHVCLRLAAQSVAVAIGAEKPGSDFNVGLLIAFFVLGAEGYFSLVLCSYRFVIHHHQHAYPVSGSWLEGKPNKSKGSEHSGDPWYKRFKRAMTARNNDGSKDPWVMTIIHWTLIGANTIIIVGGSRVNGSEYGTPDYWDRINVAKALRAVGQAIFLLINFFLATFLYLSVKQDRNPEGTLPRRWCHFFRVGPDFGAEDARNRVPQTRINPTLLVLIIAWPPLIVRGIFGLLQALVNPINYAHRDAYSSTAGFTQLFIVMENIFSVLPEWTACCLLCTTMFTKEGNRHSPGHSEQLQRLDTDTGEVRKQRRHSSMDA